MRFDAPQADEFPLIFDSWANSFRKSPWAGCIPNHLYDTVSRATIDGILNRGARVTCAVVDLPEGGRRVVGYSVSEPARGILHWIYVKRDYRKMNIGGELLRFTADHIPPGVRRTYTHRTLASARFLGDTWEHDPVPARTK